MISETEMAFQNSNIPHTLSYYWHPFIWKDDQLSCEDVAINLSNNPNAKLLRETYRADIVVTVVAPDLTWDDTNGACVSSNEVEYDNGYIVLSADKGLFNYTFSHEVGHILGALHLWAPHQPSDCAYAHELNFINPDPTGPPLIKKQTILGDPTVSLIPHYSDPYIFYDNVSTGLTDNNFDDHNNAGRIRETGCQVANYENSSTSNVVITHEQDECSLTFKPTVEPPRTDYEYTWFWSYDGIFSPQNLGAFLYEGEILTVTDDDPPFGDPCEIVFIQVVVSLNGQPISSQVTGHESGICIDNVDCDNASSSLIQFDNYVTETLNDIKYNTTQIGSQQLYLFDVYGRLITNLKNSSYIKEDLINKGYKGVYFLVKLNENGSIHSEKIIIN